MALKVTGHLLTLGMVVQKTWKIAGRAAFSEGRKLANRIAASEAGQRVAKVFKAYLVDNRGCVDLEALGVVKSKTSRGDNTTNVFDIVKYGEKFRIRKSSWSIGCLGHS